MPSCGVIAHLFSSHLLPDTWHIVKVSSPFFTFHRFSRRCFLYTAFVYILSASLFLYFLFSTSFSPSFLYIVPHSLLSSFFLSLLIGSTFYKCFREKIKYRQPSNAQKTIWTVTRFNDWTNLWQFGLYCALILGKFLTVSGGTINRNGQTSVNSFNTESRTGTMRSLLLNGSRYSHGWERQ